jgi:hypothetical protein
MNLIAYVPPKSQANVHSLCLKAAELGMVVRITGSVIVLLKLQPKWGINERD